VVLGPAHVLAVLVGLFHAALFVFVGGRFSPRIVPVALASILGAWAGDAVGSRLGVDPIRLGDFYLVSASVMAWLGIGFVTVLSILGPSGEGEDTQ
jgi:uncharacterized membrane protein YfcA